MDAPVQPERLPALSYLLVPSDPEKAKADRATLADFARQKGFKPVRYEDQLEDTRRPGRRAVIARAQGREHGVLLVLGLSHLAKTRVGVGVVVCELYASGVKVIAASGLELNPKVARWLADEATAHAKKIKRSHKVKRDRGERAGEIPYGWRLHPDGVNLIEERYEQDLIREARRLDADGYSTGAIATILAQNGWRNRANGAHSRGAIRRWLRRGW